MCKYLLDASRMKWIVHLGLVVPGRDILHRTDITLEECQDLCMANQRDCRSVDYFANSRDCFHNDVGWEDTQTYILASIANGIFYMFCELGKVVWYAYLL